MEKLKMQLEILKERRLVLKEMYEIGTISKECYDKRLSQTLEELDEIRCKMFNFEA